MITFNTSSVADMKEINMQSKQDIEIYRKNNGLKSNGVKVATPAESIRNYEDYIRVRDLLEQSKTGARDRLLWCTGIATGLRVSDLVELKWSNLYDENLSFRERTFVREKKTKKINNILITDIIKSEIELYSSRVSLEDVDINDYIFKTTAETTEEGFSHLQTKAFYKRLKKISDRNELGFHLSTHTMRKSFVDIVMANFKKNIDWDNLQIASWLLKHNNIMTTLRYSGVLARELEKARTMVSTHLMRSDIKLVTPNNTFLGGDKFIEDLSREVGDKIMAQAIKEAPYSKANFNSVMSLCFDAEANVV